jgi:8-oxo-dGTP pyrophosphatase MutT (NUDIX family)
LKILLIKRADGTWSLPGGFVEPANLKQGIYGKRVTGVKELTEETGLYKKDGSEVIRPESFEVLEEDLVVNDPLTEKDEKTGELKRYIATTLLYKHFKKEEGEELLFKDLEEKSDDPSKNEVSKIDWFSFEKAYEKNLFADHRRLIKRVEDNLNKTI